MFAHLGRQRFLNSAVVLMLGFIAIGPFTIAANAQSPDFSDVQSGSSTTAPSTTSTSGGFTPELPIPGQFEGVQEVNNDLFGRYVRAIYVYFIWTVGIVATAMIIFAGVKWVAAAGDQGRIRDARDMITNAIVGVIIALTSVILLNLLSPRFSTLSIPSIDTAIKAKYYDGISISRVCDPGKDTIENFVCNDIKKIGTRVDQNNQVQNDYCIATRCDKDEVCLIRQNKVTGKYLRGNGCVKSVRLENPTGDFASIQTIPVASSLTQVLLCSAIQKGFANSAGNPYSIANNCGGDKSKSICYMVGNTATIDDSGPIDRITNMDCPFI